MSDPDPERVLMQRIFDKWAAGIAGAIGASPLAPSFLAAVMAEESGGNPQLTRFELGTFESLCMVLLGRRRFFSPPGIQHSIGTRELTEWIEGRAGHDFARGLVYLAQLATSHGLLQIMGWHAVEFGRPLASIVWSGLSDNTSEHLSFGVFLATYFANRYMFSLSDSEKLFRCWNTGKPDGQTFDPQYVEKGLSRMALYEEIAGTPSAT